MKILTTDGALQFKGVQRQGSRWQASLRVGGVWHNLGRYDTAEDAAQAYNEAAAKLLGTLAAVNIVRPKCVALFEPRRPVRPHRNRTTDGPLCSGAGYAMCARSGDYPCAQSVEECS